MSNHPDRNRPHRPHVGELVRDHRSGRDGVYMDTQGGQHYLRPQGGGREWTAQPEHVGPVPTEEPQGEPGGGDTRSSWRFGRRRATSERSPAA